MKFSAVVGNPPYQGARIKDSDKGKPPTIWPKFVEIADSILEDDGVIVMVHPAMFRKPGSDLQKILYHNNRQLHIYNNAEAMVTFNVSSRYDWYVIDKTYTGPTRVYFEDETVEDIDLTGTEMLPNGSWSIWEKVLSLRNKVGGIETYKETTPPAGTGDYKVIQTLTPTKGVVVAKHPAPPKGYKVKKFIISETSRDGFGLFDKDGEYGTSCNCYCVKVSTDEEGESYQRFVESKLCAHLIGSTKWSNFRVEYVVWNYIFNPFLAGVRKESTDQDIYDLVGLTSKEISHIETFTYGKHR